MNGAVSVRVGKARRGGDRAHVGEKELHRVPHGDLSRRSGWGQIERAVPGVHIGGLPVPGCRTPVRLPNVPSIPSVLWLGSQGAVAGDVFGRGMAIECLAFP
ncbi:hypothetical protein GCM10027563_46010 [Parasphingorhabdus pacifica]